MWIRNNRTLLSSCRPSRTVNYFFVLPAGSGNIILWCAVSNCLSDRKLILLISEGAAGAMSHWQGLIASLFLQLVSDSGCCWVLSELYTSRYDGSEQPSESALAQCLRNILDKPDADALDECPK